MSKLRQTCPCEVCGDGTMHLEMHFADVEYKGHTGRIKAYSLQCDNCKADVVSAAEQLENKREWIRFKKTVDHIPTGAEIASMRKRNNLTQQQAGTLFGGGVVAFSKYENDDVIPDDAMVNLLKLATIFPDTVQRLKHLKFGAPSFSNTVRVSQPKMTLASNVLWSNLETEHEFSDHLNLSLRPTENKLSVKLDAIVAQYVKERDFA